MLPCGPRTADRERSDSGRVEISSRRALKATPSVSNRETVARYQCRRLAEVPRNERRRTNGPSLSGGGLSADTLCLFD